MISAVFLFFNNKILIIHAKHCKNLFFFFQILIKIFISLFNNMHQVGANIDKKVQNDDKLEFASFG